VAGWLHRAGRYFHTVRHLKPVQIYGRLWFRLYRPRPDRSPAPTQRLVTGVWQRPARREPSLLSADEFVFLGERGALRTLGWDGPQREKLWRYNQHYFDDLNALDAEARADWHRDLIDTWVRENPPGRGSGWEPYPTSLRMVNWVKWSLAGNPLSDACVQSLAVQARWLSGRLEWHLLGNHLFANAKALVFAGVFFQDKDAERWLATGLRILDRELPEQFLPDGGHFERSPMYHALAFEDMLDLCNLAGAYPDIRALAVQVRGAALWQQHALRMQRWLYAMRHPDGEISFFNDAALGVAPERSELDAYAARLGVDSIDFLPEEVWLKYSGYLRVARDDAVALLDLAPVGPDHLPGHAHADTLSFELSVYGQRVLVNSGTSCYGESPERLRQRGTAAHNAVVLNGVDSSEMWRGFRVARRAKPFGVKLEVGKVLRVRGSHDGYRRLPGRPTHERRWELGAGLLVIEDIVAGRHECAEARFHFHPSVQLCARGHDGANTDATSHQRPAGDGDLPVPPDVSSGDGLLPGGQRFHWAVEQGVARLEPTTYHPRFGESVLNQCLVVALSHGRARVRFSWSG
jgi:uncharacterized heparinase superfamily protein